MPAKIQTKNKICLNCGDSFHRGRLRSGRIEAIEDYKCRKFCSHKCSEIYHQGKNHPLYKPQGSMRKDGYVRVSINGKRFYLHRILAERKLGRKLQTNEHGHHIDENPSHNTNENIKVLLNSQHSKLHSSNRKRNKYGQFC